VNFMWSGKWSPGLRDKALSRMTSLHGAVFGLISDSFEIVHATIERTSSSAI